MKNIFARRSFLYIPGSSEKMLGKAKTVHSDAVILDLEDAVSMDEKDHARQNVVNALADLRDANKEIIVRINSADTRYCYEDIRQVVPQGVNTLIVPKADERSLIAVDMMLTALEKDLGLSTGAIGVIPLFETAYAIANAFRVLGSIDRINGVQLGAEDLTSELEINRTVEGEEILFARQQLAMAAKARKIDVIDTPYVEIRDLEGLRRETELVKTIGFTGKTCIHPAHIDVINEVFTPKQEEVDKARGILAAFEQAIAEGKGACMYEGKMIDKPIAERAQKLVEKAMRIPTQDKGE